MVKKEAPAAAGASFFMCMGAYKIPPSYHLGGIFVHVPWNRYNIPAIYSIAYLFVVMQVILSMA